MSREIQEDFKRLEAFIKKFNLQSSISDKNFVDNLKPVHKRVLGFSTLVHELDHLNESIHGITKPQMEYFLETSSDISNALFLYINGAYKGARIMLRASIESFLKAMFLPDYPVITTEKSVFNIIDTVKSLKFCLDGIHKQNVDVIISLYKDFCADVHTATSKNMAQISALSYFPKIDNEEMKALKQFFLRLIESYIFLICMKYNGYFHKMHHRNKDIVIGNINKSKRKYVVLGTED